MRIDVIITTKDRSISVAALVKSLFKNELIANIIVVDSSEQDLVNLSEYSSKVHHIISKQKNQPYQRFLGYKQSKSKILLFLDDDMVIAQANFAEILVDAFSSKKIGAIAINFEDLHDDTSLSKVPKSLIKKNSRVKRIVGWITGYPVLKDGVMGLCGVRGKQPHSGGFTQVISGGAFAVYREVLYLNFNFQLFDLYNKNIGKGEDLILGYTIHKASKIYYLNHLLFYHNDNNNSNYTKDHFKLAKRVIISRLYLSLEKSRLDQSGFAFAYLHYHWYVVWRILGLFINVILNPSKARIQILKGTFVGWAKSLSFRFKLIKDIEY